MHVTAKADYAVRAVIELASSNQASPRKVDEVAQAQGKDAEFYAFFRTLEAYRASLGDGTTLLLSPDSDFFKYFDKIPGR